MSARLQKSTHNLKERENNPHQPYNQHNFLNLLLSTSRSHSLDASKDLSFPDCASLFDGRKAEDGEKKTKRLRFTLVIKLLPSTLQAINNVSGLGLRKKRYNTAT